jgi:O-antigen/teichoic acid export membrane protein
MLSHFSTVTRRRLIRARCGHDCSAPRHDHDRVCSLLARNSMSMDRVRDAYERTRRIAAHLRLRPYDSATPAGRAAERYRRAAWSTLAALGARVVAMAVSLVTIPLALGYLGPEQYGLWVTISAVTAMLTFADFGLGNGLMNFVADAYGRDDRAAAQRAVSSAFLMLLAVAGIGVGAFGLAFGSISWADVANVSSEAARADAGPTVAVFFLCFAASLPLSLVQRVQYGYQEGFEVSMWAALGSVLGLAGVVVAIQLGARLPWLVLAIAGGPLVATALNAAVVFTRRHPDLRPRLRLATGGVAVRLVRVGLLFFMLQVAVAVAFQSDIVVAAQILGPEAAAEYSVVLRLFFVVPTVLSMALLPLWPAYGEAIARGDLPWLRRTLVRTTAISTAVAALSSSLLLVFANDVLRLWLGPVFDPPLMLLLGMALWAVVSTAFTSIAMLLNGATVIRFQAVAATVMAVASIAASITLAGPFGVSGIIWGTLLAYLACTALPTLWYLPRVFRQLEWRLEHAVG